VAGGTWYVTNTVTIMEMLPTLGRGDPPAAELNR
jgi:hypothetical protein